MMTEARPGLKTGAGTAAGDPEIPIPALWLSIPLNLGPDTALFVGASEESWLPIGRSALLAAGLTEITQARAPRTHLENPTQAASGLAPALPAKLGRAVA